MNKIKEPASPGMILKKLWDVAFAADMLVKKDNPEGFADAWVALSKALDKLFD